MPDVVAPERDATQPSPFQQALLADPSLEARRMPVPPGAVLLDAADSHRLSAAPSIYFVHRGQVRLYHTTAVGNGQAVAGSAATRTEARLVEIIGPGQWCGLEAISGRESSAMRAVAYTASVVSEVAVDRFLAVLPRHPQLAVELMRQLAAKLEAAHGDASRLVFHDCHQRLISTLLRFSESAAAAPQPGGVILRITHDQLAQAVGVARETVSLALTQLRQQNIVRTGRNQLMFSPEVLRRIQAGRPAHPESARNRDEPMERVA